MSPFATAGEVGLADSRWEGGFWGDRVEQCRAVAVPAMWQTLNDPTLSHAFSNFRIAAGLEQGSHAGPPFFDGDLYKWLEAATTVHALTGDAELDRLTDGVIDVIARAQRSDGYLHTPVLIGQRASGQSVRELADRLHFEVYNFGHLITAGCRHHAATGKSSLLDVARRAADYLCAYFRDPTPEKARNSICPSHYMGLVELYHTTGQAAYLDLANRLIAMRDLISDGTDDNQDRTPLRAQREAVGHAVRATYLYAGTADVYAETGESALLEALLAIWDSAVLRKTYVTGGAGALFDGVSPDGGEDHNAIQRVHQAYGRDYQLPNVTAYGESCANIGNALWNWRMWKLTGEARFMDVVETVLYNSLPAAVSLDGTRFFYRNALRRQRDLPFPLRWSPTRERFISSFCCPPNVLRTIAGSSRWAYGVSTDAVWVNLYGSGSLATALPNGSSLSLRQRTDYPWSGTVTIEIVDAPRRPLAVNLRIPAWAREASVRIGGRPVREPVEPGSYLELRRPWARGDRIELDLPLEPRLMMAHPLVEECRNQVCVARGPVVYCLESGDLPDGVAVSDVLIPSDLSLSPKSGDGVLRDAVVLEGQAERLEVPPGASRSLYREIRAPSYHPQPVTLIPYYAWDNRGPSEMSVWLPVRWR